jgi:hypothetical protein
MHAHHMPQAKFGSLLSHVMRDLLAIALLPSSVLHEWDSIGRVSVGRLPQQAG